MKGKRQNKIIEIIAKEPIRTQDELAAALSGHGIQATQATVSRDIKELRLIKTVRSDGYVYSLPEEHSTTKDAARMRKVIGGSVLRIDSSENIIVIHTLPGNANSVSYLIDAEQWGDLLGTVAGDDTIIAVARSKDLTQSIVERLQDLLE